MSSIDNAYRLGLDDGNALFMWGKDGIVDIRLTLAGVRILLTPDQGEALAAILNTASKDARARREKR